MKLIILKIKNLTKKQQIAVLVVGLFITLSCSVILPSLARFVNRSSIDTVVSWNGDIATRYKSGSGTESDPYIISTGAELAYFSNQLKTTDYLNTYFELENDILLNNGALSYDNNNLIYTLNNKSYYINKYTNIYYEDLDYQIKSGSLNQLNSLDNFKGTFNGDYHGIYGLYMTSNSDELALFTNLSGTVSNLYVENSLIYGGSKSAGIASTASNTSLKNILYDGYVINDSIKNLTNSSSLTDYTSDSVENTIPLNIDVSPLASISSISLSGSLLSSNNITINDQTVSNGDFTLTLDNTLTTNLTVKNDSNTSFTLSNLNYTIIYDEAISAGIVADATTINLENVINKGNIIGNQLAAGLVGKSTGALTINQSYNNGSIISSITSGLVGVINNTNSAIITKSYNTGLVNNIASSIINTINNSDIVSINNVFNTTDIMPINNIYNSVVNITNSYTTSLNNPSLSTNGLFSQTTIDYLTNKNNLINNLSFNEFNNDITSLTNVFVYEDNALPILFIDDGTKPIANIHVSTYTWNNYSNILNNVIIDNNITFSMESSTSLKPLKEIEYYVSKSREPKTLEELDLIDTWNKYENVTTISTEGAYIIYAKVTDSNNNITYLNSDILILDLTGSDITITMDDKTWKEYSDIKTTTIINNPKIITIESIDELSGLASLSYLESESILSIDELNALPLSSWILYTDPITINTPSTKIIYVKSVNNSNQITYANTSYISYNGYTASLSVGKNSLVQSNYATSSSIINYNFKFQDIVSYSDLKHVLKSAIALPSNTKIILFDNINNKKYTYSTSLPESTIYLSSFKDINDSSLFSDEIFYNKDINEDFTLWVDFSNSRLDNNLINQSINLELENANDRIKTLNANQMFNVYTSSVLSNPSTLLQVTTDNRDTIYLNSKSESYINLVVNLNKDIIDGKEVINSKFENSKLGLAIKLIDEANNVIDTKKYSNIKILLNDIEYTPINNIFYLPCDTSNLILKIVTDDSTITIPNGKYYLQINSYLSDDIIPNYISNESVKLPVIVGTNNKEYEFDVTMDDGLRLIPKNGDTNLLFTIKSRIVSSNPNIRVSLYKKTYQTAYNNEYTQIDIKDYINEGLENYYNYVYYAIKNPIMYNNTLETINNFSLHLKNNIFEKNAYKFVFELYDDSAKVNTIEKKFVVR